MIHRTFPKSVQPGIPKLTKECPRGWNKLKLNDVFEIIQNKAKLDDEKKYRLLTVKRSRGGIELRSVLKGKEIKTKTQYWIEGGEFLISRRQIVHGACGIVPIELGNSIVSNEYLILKNKDIIDLCFMNYYSNTIYFQQTCFHASVGVHVEKMIFKPDWWFKFNHYLPPLPEQKKIAKILSTWDTAITKTKALIQKKQELKKGLMQVLLTGKVRFGEFVEREGVKKSKLGLIPKDWEVFRLEDVANFKNGKGHENIINENGKYILVNSKFVSTSGTVIKKTDEQLVSLSTTDIVMVMSDVPNGKTIAKCFLIDKNDTYSLNQRVCGITAMKVDLKFLYFILNRNPYYLKFDTGVGQTNFRKQQVLDCPLRIPSLKEQKKIAKVLSSCDQGIQKLNDELAQLQAQKKGLMQQLLTGATRVKVEA